MIYLPNTSTKLQAVMSGAAATTNPKVAVGWTLTNNEGVESKGYTTIATLSGTNDVDICAAPEVNGFVVNVKSVHIVNIDTAAVTVTVKLDVSGTDTQLKKATLAVGETLWFNSMSGWSPPY